MYAKVFTQIYDGTLCTRGPWQALVTFQQMLVLADKDGIVDMTAEAISRRTTIPLEIIETGIAELVKEDPRSRTPEEGGRRLALLSPDRDWGWRVVNYKRYRGLKREEDRRDYHRSYYAKRVVPAGTQYDSTFSTPLNTSQPIQPIQPISEAEAEAEAECESTRARPEPVDHCREFTARRMRSVFVAEYEAVMRCTPGMGGKAVGDLYGMVVRTAELQGADPATLFMSAVRTWLSKALSDRERQSPYACFTQAWGTLTAQSSRPRSAPSGWTPGLP